METTEQDPNPFDRRCCYDCGWLTAYVSWWCKSKDAAKYWGTSIPGQGQWNCKFWKPDWSHINTFWKLYHKAQLHQIID